MISRRSLAALAALALGLGLAGACGDSPREQPEKGNQGQQIPEGSKSMTDTGPTTLGSTGAAQPEVTQPKTGP
jgi:hypothetical protein